MGSNLFLGLVLGMAAGTWIYTKMMRSTGNNTKNSLTVAGIGGLFAMIVFIIILNAVTKK